MATIITTFKLKFTILLMALLIIGPTAVFAQAGKNYQHWADGDAATGSSADWNNNILSANKSDYFEGEVIPHVAILPASNNAPLVQNQTYSFTVVYNYYQSNTNAGGFAYITTYNISRQPTPFGTITPSLDPNGATGSGSQGVFYVGPGVDVISAGTPVKSGSGTFDNTVTITFKWTGATTTSGAAYIFYGLYISEPAKVPDQGKGATLGAHAWTGGSLQTTLNSTFTGGLSLQLNPAAIIVGSISGLKFSDLNNNGIKDAGEPVLSNWVFYLDNNNNGIKDVGEVSTTTDANGVFSFSVTPDANKNTSGNDPYYVREVQQQGYTQTLPNSTTTGVTNVVSYGYGPITITALAPTSTGNDFGNYNCVQPTANTASSALCSKTAGGTTADFNLTNLESTVKGSQTGVTVSWYSDATLQTAITTPSSYTSATATVYAKVTSNTSSSCYNSSSVSLTVNRTPTASTASATLCAKTTSGTTADFDLTSLESTVKGSQTGVTVSWYSDATLQTAITTPSSYTSATATVYAKVYNSSATSCSSSAQVSLTVNPNATSSAGTAPAAQCYDATNGNTFALDGSGSNGTPKWTVYTNTNNLNVLFSNDAIFKPNVTITGGSGSVTLRLTVTSSYTPSCGTPISDVIVTVNAIPNISTPAIGAVCLGAKSATVSYSTPTGSPDQYRIDWNAAAETAGLTDIAYTSLPASPFNITIPGTLTSGTYNGTIYVKNSTTGCESAGAAISLTVNAALTAPDVTYNAPACDKITFSLRIGSLTAGDVYTVLDAAGNAISGVSPSSPHTVTASEATTSYFTFSNIPAGSGYKVSYTHGDCISSVTSCGTANNACTSTAAPLVKKQIQTIQNYTATIDAPQTRVLAAPNPYTNRVRFTLESAVSGQGSLELFNMLGQKVSSVFQGYVEAGKAQSIEYSVPGNRHANLLYVFKVGSQKASGKLIGLQ